MIMLVGWVEKDEERNKHNLEPMPSVTKVHAAYRTVKSSFCMQSISQCDEHNILNLELALPHLHIELQLNNCQLQIVLEKSDLQAGIKVTFYLFIIFVGLNEGKLEGRIEMTARRGRRCKQLLDNFKEKRRYWKLNEHALDRTLWRTRFGRGYRPVVRQTTE
jgi:hypothetical protein